MKRHWTILAILNKSENLKLQQKCVCGGRVERREGGKVLKQTNRSTDQQY